MGTVINTLEGVKNLQLNEIERASTQLPPGTQTFSISSEQFISVNSEAESDSRICFSFLFSSFHSALCRDYLHQTGRDMEMSLYAKATPPKGKEPLVRISTRRQPAMAQLQKMLLVRNTFYLPSQRSGWVSSPCPVSPLLTSQGSCCTGVWQLRKLICLGKVTFPSAAEGKKPNQKAQQTQTPTLCACTDASCASRHQCWL